jgi:hypothetical protein
MYLPVGTMLPRVGRLLKLASAVLLIALLSVPLALGAHHHGTHQTVASCAVCVVAHFTPVTAGTGVALPVPVVSFSAPPPLRPTLQGRLEAAVHRGRAPPSLPNIPVS